MRNTSWRKRLMAVTSLLALASPVTALAVSATDEWDQYAPIVLGEGHDEVVVFTAPSCPYCRQLIDHLPALAKRYRVIVLPISFTGYDAHRVRALACAADQDAAARAFLLHQDIVLPQQESCDLGTVEARYAEAYRRRVISVPYIIRPDGEINAGLRPDLDAWLARGTQP